MRSMVGAVLALALGACTAIATRGDLVGVPGLGDDVRRFYERLAWEQSGSCLFPRMEAILRAEVVDAGEDTTTVRVRYVWNSGGARSVDGGNTCRGTAERDFVVRPIEGGATVLSMTGGQRRM